MKINVLLLSIFFIGYLSGGEFGNQWATRNQYFSYSQIIYLNEINAIDFLALQFLSPKTAELRKELFSAENPDFSHKKYSVVAQELALHFNLYQFPQFIELLKKFPSIEKFWKQLGLLSLTNQKLHTLLANAQGIPAHQLCHYIKSKGQIALNIEFTEALRATIMRNTSHLNDAQRCLVTSALLVNDTEQFSLLNSCNNIIKQNSELENLKKSLVSQLQKNSDSNQVSLFNKKTYDYFKLALKEYDLKNISTQELSPQTRNRIINLIEEIANFAIQNAHEENINIISKSLLTLISLAIKSSATETITKKSILLCECFLKFLQASDDLINYPELLNNISRLWFELNALLVPEVTDLMFNYHLENIDSNQLFFLLKKISSFNKLNLSIKKNQKLIDIHQNIKKLLFSVGALYTTGTLILVPIYFLSRTNYDKAITFCHTFLGYPGLALTIKQVSDIIYSLLFKNYPSLSYVPDSVQNLPASLAENPQLPLSNILVKNESSSNICSILTKKIHQINTSITNRLYIFDIQALLLLLTYKKALNSANYFYHPGVANVLAYMLFPSLSNIEIHKQVLQEVKQLKDNSLKLTKQLFCALDNNNPELNTLRANGNNKLRMAGLKIAKEELAAHLILQTTPSWRQNIEAQLEEKFSLLWPLGS